MFPATTTPASGNSNTNQLKSQEVSRNQRLAIPPSDFGVEIGGVQSFEDLPRTPATLPREIVRWTNIAFAESHLAKMCTGWERESHYSQKNRAINFLLERNHARVNSVDWDRDDPLLDIWFSTGGKLHMMVSCLDVGG